MPDLLGVTNPVPGRDATGVNYQRPVNPNDLNVQNIPDPSRVGRPDARTDRQDDGDATKSQALRYGSNYNAFLQRLKDSPDLTATLSRLLLGRTVVSSGVGEGIAAELAQFMEMLQMDQTQLLHFFTQQLGSGSRFGGALFNILRGAMAQGNSEGMQADILLFLKKYADWSSSSHVEGNLMRSVNQLVRSVPASFAGKLIDMAAELQNCFAAGDRAGALKLLQGQLMPYMSEYVERTHDMGRARQLLTFLALDIARYENGSEGGLLQAFHQLKNYSTLRDRLGGLDDKTLLNLLRNTEFAKASGQNTFAETLSAAADRALRGAGGADAQNAFRELVSAFLVNESVYMTVNHMIIPLEWDGRMLFSELWVDPDAEQESRSGADGEGRTLRFLFKLDIQSLGFFDLVLSCREKTVELQLRCPERVLPFARTIEGALGRILTDHGLQARSVQVTQMDRPLSVTEVFPKLFDGKDSVNVKV